MKISNLLNKDTKIVEKKKIFFAIPACIVVIAIIVMTIFGIVTKEPLNLGMDFAGGYTISVKLGTKVNDGNYNVYKNKVSSLITGLKDENGNNYNLKISNIQRQGSAETTSIYVKFKPQSKSTNMEEVEEKLQSLLEKEMFKIIPDEVYNGNEVTFTYSIVLTPSNIKAIGEGIKTAIDKINEENNTSITVGSVVASVDKKSIVATLSDASALNDAAKGTLKESILINDGSSGSVSKPNSVSPTVSNELLATALIAAVLSLLFMMSYIIFRFEISAGIGAIVALIHDIIIMFSFMAIFRIEITATFIAALITILGYSINNTIIIFDRIRENAKMMIPQGVAPNFIANKSVRETLLRSINTTLTTLIMIAMVAIIGVYDIRIFAIPIIIGLLAGTYSSICIAPSIWALWHTNKLKKDKHKDGKDKHRDEPVKKAEVI